MTRTSLFHGKACTALAVAVALFSLRAAAQDAAAAAPATTDGQVSDKADDKDGEKKDDKGGQPQLNARLAPGGIVQGEKGFPLHVNVTLDNAVGNGMLAATQYQRQPQWSSSLSIRPSAALPKFDFLPRMLVSASLDLSVNNWISTFSNGEVYDRQVRASDFGMGLIFPALLKEEFTGITATPVLSMRLPLSITSRMQNLALSAAASAQVAWNSPETPVGVFTLIYSPALRGNLYTQDAPSIPCSAGIATNGVVTNPLQNGDVPLAYGRTAEVLSNGECRLVGRQGLASLSNSGSASWSLGDHNVALSLGWGVGFLRPLANRPDLNSPNASGQNFNENSNSSLSYTYTVPIETQLFLTTGLYSQQPALDMSGDVRFPFFDFWTPANNFSGAFFDVTVGI